MNKIRIIGAAALFSMAATAGMASAADYTITWKNQFASNPSCSLLTSVVGPMGTVPNTTSYTFTSLGQTTRATVSSPSCIRITLSASCSYTDAQGKTKRVSFGSANASCENSTATLNPSIPGSITVTPTQDKPRNIPFT